VFCFFQV